MPVDEEHEHLTPESPLTPDPCNNNQPDFISELDKKTPTDFKDDHQKTIEEREPAAVIFPMEIPVGFPNDINLGPGSSPGLLVFSPVQRSCSEHYVKKIDSEKTDNTELEVRNRL